MKRTAFVLSAMLFATYSVADQAASAETTPKMTLAAAETSHQTRWSTAQANPAARAEQAGSTLSDKTLELTQNVNAQLEARLAEKMNFEFELDF